MALITLTTDFGLKDVGVSIMKGVILRIAPQTQIVDISHLVTPQNIFEGAGILFHATSFFPENAIHIAVIDPGVGTDRRPLLAKIGSQFFVGPDNGVFTLVLKNAYQNKIPVECMKLTNKKYWLDEISSVFHGRDIFAPVAAHLAIGHEMHGFGVPIDNPVMVEYPEPEMVEHGWRGRIIYIDSFGNIATNITKNHVVKNMKIVVNIGGVSIDKFSNTFGNFPDKSIICLIGGNDSLCVSVVNGNAAEKLGVKIGDSVEMLLA